MSLGFDHNGHAETYARAALDRECDLAAATGHGRNDQLNRSAFSLGQLVGAGLLGRAEVERRLYAAADASGYVGKDGSLAARATIKSGLDKGEREPRVVELNGHSGAGRRAPAPFVPVTPPRPAPALHGVPLPDWTAPDAEGRPKFFAVGVTDPRAIAGEMRRHVYRRDGEPVRVKVKLEDGGFRDFYRVRRPDDGAVGWQARKPEGYVPMPYVGPLDAFDPFDPEHLGEVLHWPEGEKDVDALQRAGLVAFTFGGSSDVPDCADLLRDRDLVILADNDEPGERCAARKAALAHGAAARVRVVRFPELDAGGDVSDFLAAGGVPADLDARAEEPPAPVPAAPILFADPGAAGRSDGAQPVVLTAHGFVWRDPSTFPRRRWLYGHHLIRKFISSTVSPGGVGKTSLILVEAIAMCTGLDLLGTKPREAPLRVWVYNLEDPLEELERRVVAICLHNGIDPAPLQGRLFLDSGRDQPLIVARQDGKAVTIATPVVDALTEEVRARQIDVLVVDPFVSCHRVNENDNPAIDDVAKTFARIADGTGCAIDLVHHVRKGHGEEITVDDGRGASALLGAVRSARVLNPMSAKEAEEAGVANPRRHFRTTNGKANLAPPASGSTWFHLESVSLGNGTGGAFDDSDHVGVVEPWTWPNAMDGVTLNDLRAVQRIVSHAQWRDDVRASEWVGKAVAQVLRLDVRLPTDKAKIAALLKIWIRNGALIRAEREDKDRKMRWYVEVGTWA